jgi:hypothetical protein
VLNTYAYFRHFLVSNPFFTVVVFREKTCRVETFGISFILSVSFFHVSSSYPEETPNYLDEKSDSFTSFTPVFTTGLIGIFLPQ